MRISAVALVIILAVVSLAACGGGEEEEGAPAAAASPAAAAEAPGAATPTPSEAAAPAATPTPSEAALAAGSLSDLNSYRYSIKIELKGLESILAESLGGLPGEEPADFAETMDMEISGAFVAPDRAEAHMQISGLEDELAMTVIEDQQWMQWGDLVIGPEVFTDDISEMDLALAMWEGFSEEAGGLTCASEKKETVNDIPCSYCGIDQATFEQLASLFGSTEDMGNIDELSLDMWLAEDGGWPVRLRAHVAGSDESGQEFEAKLEMDITDVNEEIEIKPPSQG